MPLVSKLRLRYERRVGFPGYSHLEIEVEEEIILEEGDIKDEVAAMALSSQGHLVKVAMQPVVDLYRTKELPEPKTKSSPEEALKAEAVASKKAHKQKEAKKAAAGQPTLDGVLDEREDLPTEREPARDMPVYSEEGQRIRGMGQKAFKIAEINEAWEALVIANVVDTKPDYTKNANQDRQDIRAWLKMSPLDPRFSKPELDVVIESYDKWRGQGLTTVEAMEEVGNDYIGVYGEHTKGTDADDAPEGSQEAEAGEDEAESVDQDAGEANGDARLGPEPGEPGSTPGQGDPEVPIEAEAE